MKLSLFGEYYNYYRRRKLVSLIIFTAIILYLVSFATGGFVGIVGGAAEFFARTPYILLFTTLLAIIVIAGMLYYIIKYKDLRFLKKKFITLLALLIIIIIAGGIINAIIVIPSSGKVLASEYVKYIDEPITVSMTRIIPLETAYAYAVSMLQIPTHKIYMDESYLYYIGDSVIYNWIIEPEGTWNELFREAYGAVFINGSSYPPKIKFVNSTLYWSIHRKRLTPLFINTLYREIKVRALSCKPLFEDNVEVLVDGKIYILIPLVTWVRDAIVTIPVLYGYAVVYPSGRIDIVGASNLRNNPITMKAFYEYKVPILPEVIARQWIELYRWSPGFINVAFYHQTFVIRDIGSNPQPYLVFDENGHLYWLFVVEPSGESYAIKHIIYVDAESIEPKILVYTPKTQWIGASRIASYIQKAHPRYDWERFQLAEPIPLIINNTLYWKITIITSDGRGVISIDLVDAQTGNVYSIPVETQLSLETFKLFIKTLSGQIANETQALTPTTSQQEIQRIKKRIIDIINELQKLLKEIEELEKQINKTKTT